MGEFHGRSPSLHVRGRLVVIGCKPIPVLIGGIILSVLMGLMGVLEEHKVSLGRSS